MLPNKDVTSPAVRRRINEAMRKQQSELGFGKGQPLTPDAIAHPVDRELMEALDNAHLFSPAWGVL